MERLELLQKQCEMVVAYENKQITTASLPLSLIGEHLSVIRLYYIL